MIVVEAPYNKRFIQEARKLNGKWTPPVWRFDARDTERVKDACRDAYGDDGETADLVTLRLTTREESRTYCDSFCLHGRPLVRAFGRDSGSRLCDGVILLDGSVSSGGSRKNWATVISAGTVLLVRDFPRQAAEALVAKCGAEGTKHDYAIEDQE
jgi:hypothetical protein